MHKFLIKVPFVYKNKYPHFQMHIGMSKQLMHKPMNPMDTYLKRDTINKHIWITLFQSLST